MSHSNRSALVASTLALMLTATGCEALQDLAKEVKARPDQGGGTGGPKDPGPVAQACTSSTDCGAGTSCTTEAGVCDAPPGCGPGKVCPAVCYGTCAPKTDPGPKGEPCGAATCGAGLVCCNASCGVCTPPGGGCTKQLCPSAECKTDADCRTFSNYCDGCGCDALPVGAPDPVCGGTIVQCFVDPCFNRAASCQAGKCALVDTSAPACDKRTQGGPTSCKPPELWKTYASDDCAASGLALSEIFTREDCGGGNTRFVDYVCCKR